MFVPYMEMHRVASENVREMRERCLQSAISQHPEMNVSGRNDRIQCDLTGSCRTGVSLG